jgi:hypothetical protein
MINREKINVGPHMGVMKFKVYIYRMLSDGSYDPIEVDCADLFKEYGMADNGEIHVVGFDKWNCVQKVKEKLEGLSGT